MTFPRRCLVIDIVTNVSNNIYGLDNLSVIAAEATIVGPLSFPSHNLVISKKQSCVLLIPGTVLYYSWEELLNDSNGACVTSLRL